MTEREALLRAVCEFPDDDTPRLVYADWLQEHGEEARAEFIRLQCRRESSLATTMDEWAGELAREMTLQETHSARWMRELPEYETPRLDWGRFERGFVGEALSIRADVQRDEFGNLLWVDTSLAGVDWNALYDVAPIARLIFHNLTYWRSALEPPATARLKSVCLDRCVIDDNGLRALSDWARRSTGRLLVKHDELDPAVDTFLKECFGERYYRKPELSY